MARVIPDRSNRSLWWLTASIGYVVVWVGPVAGAFSYHVVYDVPIARVITWLWAVNTLILTIVLIAGAFALGRIARPLDRGQALAFAMAIGIAGALLRMIMILLSTAAGMTPFAEVGTPFYLVQLALGLLFIATLTASIMYASSQERVLNEAFAEVSRAQLSLAQEEEQVRALVFDQLHGSLQAQFVAWRQKLTDLAGSTGDANAARIALEVEQGLERAYRIEVQSIARTLMPAGLEAGLGVAVEELAERLAGAVTLDVRIDPVVEVMENPMTGGLRRDLRLTAYRIVEEAASNAMKHSEAHEVAVEISSALSSGSPVLVIEVTHAIAEPVVVTEGSGLERMGARARALGGAIAYDSSGDQFAVRAVIPLAQSSG